jgi:hypothetical protein
MSTHSDDSHSSSDAAKPYCNGGQTCNVKKSRKSRKRDKSPKTVSPPPSPLPAPQAPPAKETNAGCGGGCKRRQLLPGFPGHDEDGEDRRGSKSSDHSDQEEQDGHDHDHDSSKSDHRSGDDKSSSRCKPKPKPKPCKPCKPCKPKPRPSGCCIPGLKCKELLFFRASKSIDSLHKLLIPICASANSKLLPDKLWEMLRDSKQKAIEFFKQQLKCAHLEFCEDNVRAYVVNPRLQNTFLTDYAKGECGQGGRCCGTVHEAFWAYVDEDADRLWQFGFWFIVDKCHCEPRVLHYKTNCPSVTFPLDEDVLTGPCDCRCPQNCNDFTTDLLVFDFCEKKQGLAKVVYSFDRTQDCQIRVAVRSFVELTCPKKLITVCQCSSKGKKKSA